MLDDLPQPIKDHILRSVGNDDYQSKPNTYSVTELLYCLRKSYFKRVCPKNLSLEQAFNIYRGKVFDQLWTPLFKHNQVRATYRCQKAPVTISGKYDFLTTDNPPILTDLKTAKSLYYINAPSEEYVKQVRFYAWLNSIERAQILYVDFGNAKAFPVEVGNCIGLFDELENKALQLYTSLQTKTPPPKENMLTHEWLCQRCEYAEVCNNEKSEVSNRA